MVVPAYFVLKSFVCFFLPSEVSEPVLIAVSWLHDLPHVSVSKETFSNAPISTNTNTR